MLLVPNDASSTTAAPIQSRRISAACCAISVLPSAPPPRQHRHEMRDYYVYIMTNRSKTLYIGVTNNIARRVYEHKHMLKAGFTRRYLIDRLVYYEPTSDVEGAIAREKQLKGWVRRRKVTLIESVNPTWRDLSGDF
jgi:putative endonuclease